MNSHSNNQYSVLLIEDDEITRQRLRQVIESHPTLTIFAEAASCAEARAALDVGPPSVMLIDLGLPDGSGIDLISDISNRGYQTEVMVLTVFRDEKSVVSAIEAGASGYLLKDGESDYIGDSIVRLLNGDSPISASIARHLLKRFNRPDQQANLPKNITTPSLTKREAQILNYVAKGFNTAEMAGILSLSHHTITTHIKQIYKKLSVKSRTEAVYEATKLGIIEQ
jgi:DNA-binding NarL/FixJ family response regulator